jgi:hypothetical protein
VGCVLHNFGNMAASKVVTSAQACPKAAKQYDYSSLKIKWL